jgi:hypothetical protein
LACLIAEAEQMHSDHDFMTGQLVATVWSRQNKYFQKLATV